MSVIQNICDAIIQNENLQEQMLKAAYCFENYHGMSSDAWDDDIKSIQPTHEEIAQLKLELISFIKTNSNSEFIGSAIWAFSKIAEGNEKEFLNKLLKIHLDKDPQVLYQIMCAIDNIGEKIFLTKSSLLDVEKNISQTKKYLKIS